MSQPERELKPTEIFRIEMLIRNGFNSRKTAKKIGMSEGSFCNWKKQPHIKKYITETIQNLRDTTMDGTTTIGSKTVELGLIEMREKEIYQKDPLKYINEFRETKKPPKNLTNIFHVNVNTQGKIYFQIKTPHYDKVFNLIKASQQQINFNQQINNNNEALKQTGMIAVPYEVETVKEMQNLLDINAKRVDEKIEKTQIEYNKREKEFNKAD